MAHVSLIMNHACRYDNCIVELNIQLLLNITELITQKEFRQMVWSWCCMEINTELIKKQLQEDFWEMSMTKSKYFERVTYDF